MSKYFNYSKENLNVFRTKFHTKFIELSFFEKYVAISMTLMIALLFLITIRDLIVPYKVNAFLKGSVYEIPDREPDRRALRINGDVNIY